MCGIAGVLCLSKCEVPRTGNFFALFESSLNHRGPDDRGALFWDGTDSFVLAPDCRPPGPYRVALFNTRLSILDLSKAGRQPMTTPDGRYAIVYNGEVYNYRELRRELESCGCRFRSQTDTEVVLHAYAVWGAEALNRFVGMFAFAILDAHKCELFLARDFFGIKPLYYAFLPWGFAFASEIKALTPLLEERPKVHPQRLYEYLRYGLTDHTVETLIHGVYHLPPAHYMRVSLENPFQVKLVQYWSPVPEEKIEVSFGEAAQKLRELFLESVQLHLRSDVPLGTALSGGIDSSAIVCAMRYLDPKAEIHTFSFVPREDQDINEERWVDIVVQAAQAQAHKVCPRPEELVEDLDELIYAQDEPFGSTSIYAQYRVFRLAREHGIKVMLDGQGGDELLAGYPTYYASRLLSLLRHGRYQEAWQFFQRASRLPASQGRFSLLKRVLAHLLPPFMQAGARRLVGEELLPAWLNEEWFRERGVQPQPMWRSTGKNALKEHLLHTLSITSLPALLRYEDRNSMWHSIESRVPFLTPQMAKFIYALPEEYILSREGTTKAIFRAAMQGIVPDEILERRDKIGFQTPERQWLATLSPWVEKVLMSEVARSIPALRIDVARQEWEAMLQGKRPFDRRFWRWVNLIRWTERFGVQYD